MGAGAVHFEDALPPPISQLPPSPPPLLHPSWDACTATSSGTIRTSMPTGQNVESSSSPWVGVPSDSSHAAWISIDVEDAAYGNQVSITQVVVRWHFEAIHRPRAYLVQVADWYSTFLSLDPEWETVAMVIIDDHQRQPSMYGNSWCANDLPSINGPGARVCRSVLSDLLPSARVRVQALSTALSAAQHLVIWELNAHSSSYCRQVSPSPPQSLRRPFHHRSHPCTASASSVSTTVTFIAATTHKPLHCGVAWTRTIASHVRWGHESASAVDVTRRRIGRATFAL